MYRSNAKILCGRTEAACALWLPILLGLALVRGCSSPSPHSIPEQWVLAPDLRIGSLDAPDYALTEVLDLAVGSDGAMYVVQWREQAIRVFDRTGRLIDTIGRRGAGPGEFEAPRRVGWRGDTLWILDTSLNRLNYFSADGRFLTSIHFVAPPVGPYFTNLRPGIPLADGAILLVPGAYMDRLADGTIQARPVLRLTRTGEVMDTIAQLGVRNNVLRVWNPFTRHQSLGPQPFSDGPLLEVARDGEALIVVERTAAEAEGQREFRITKLDTRGDTLFSRGYPYTPQPLEGDLVDSYVSERTESLIARWRATRTAVASWVREGLFVPNYHAPVTALVSGQDGTIWLRREDLENGSVQWNVFDTHGKHVAVLESPSNLEILRANRTFVWGVETDEFDVPYIVRYQVRHMN